MQCCCCCCYLSFCLSFRYTSLEEEKKTAIKTNFKFMAARIKWIFVRKMILEQDTTHCKCVIACAAVASCCIFFYSAYVERTEQFSTNLLCFVCNFSYLFVFLLSLSPGVFFGESHTCNKYISRKFYFILSSNICDDDDVCAIRVDGVSVCAAVRLRRERPNRTE